MGREVQTAEPWSHAMEMFSSQIIPCGKGPRGGGEGRLLREGTV